MMVQHRMASSFRALATQRLVRPCAGGVARGSRRWSSDDAGGTAAIKAALTSSRYPQPRDGVAWEKLGFSLASRDTKMIVATCKQGGRWDKIRSEPYGPLSLEPAATIINYGQGIFEGIKAYRTVKDRIVLFRPQKNGRRMSDGARRLLMPPVPPQLFLEACAMAVRDNADWVPPCGGGALYLRPILFGSGADLGVKPSSEYMFVIYVSPVGQYFGPGTTGARMQLCFEHHRAAVHGVGNVKMGGNYAQCFQAQRDAKDDGFSDVIYLDVTGEHIEEAAASNFFCVDENKVVHTPALGTILPGVTRDSVLTIVRKLQDQGVTLKVGKVSADTALNAKEAWLTGTGAGITPIENISSPDVSHNMPCPGPITTIVKETLYNIQQEHADDEESWLYDPFMQPAVSKDSFVDPVF